MRSIKPLRLCNNCGYLYSEGYEYPEYYCAAGVADDDPLLVGDGCIYTDRQLEIKKEYFDEQIDKAYSGDFSCFFSDEGEELENGLWS